MKSYRNIINSALLIGLFLIAGCNNSGNDDPKPTAKEELQTALETSNWVVDAANTDVSSVTGDFDVSTFTITFASTTPGSNFTLGGDIASYISGGAFEISDAGAASNPTVIADPTLEVTNITDFAVTSTSFRITINTQEAGGRFEGVGEIKLAFNAN